MKGAQLGLSEYAINLCVWTTDTARGGRGNSLFVQPNGEMMRDFAQARGMPVIEESEYLAGRLRRPDNTGLIRVGRAHAYWRASGSRAGLKSVDADTVVLDEFDEMAPEVLELAAHRLDSSLAPLMRIISTPNYPGGPIETAYLAGDQPPKRSTHSSRVQGQSPCWGVGAKP